MADPNAEALTPTPVYRGGTAPLPAITATPPAQKLKLLDQVRQAIRTRHYSPRTEETYVHWIKRFIFFHNKRHPAEMGRERNRPLPLQPGKRATCKRVHAEPGIKCNSVSLPTGFAQRHWLRRRRCPCQPANEATDGINATGSKVYFRRARPPKPAVFDGERNVDKLR